MSEVEIGIAEVLSQEIDSGDLYGGDMTFVESLEDNGDDFRNINEASTDRAYRPSYHTEEPFHDNDGKYSYLSYDSTEITVYPYQSQQSLMSLEQAAPTSSDHEGMPGSINVGVGVGYPPVNAGVSYTFPEGEGRVSRTELGGKGGWSWEIRPDDIPMGPEDPDSETIEDVPTAEVGIEPDALENNPEYRWVWSETRHNYNISTRAGIFPAETDKLGSYMWYRVVE